jgi:hypothetical protein
VPKLLVLNADAQVESAVDRVIRGLGRGVVSYSDTNNKAPSRGDRFDVIVICVSAASAIPDDIFCTRLRSADPDVRIIHLAHKTTVDLVDKHVKHCHDRARVPAECLSRTDSWEDRFEARLRQLLISKRAAEYLHALFPQSSSPAGPVPAHERATDYLVALRLVCKDHWLELDQECRDFIQYRFPKAPAIGFHDPLILNTRAMETPVAIGDILSAQERRVLSSDSFNLTFNEVNVYRRAGACSLNLASAYRDELERVMTFLGERDRTFERCGRTVDVFAVQSSHLELSPDRALTDIDTFGHPYIMLPSHEGAEPWEVQEWQPDVWREVARASNWCVRDPAGASESWQWFDQLLSRYCEIIGRLNQQLNIPAQLLARGLSQPLDRPESIGDALLFIEYLESVDPGLAFNVWRHGNHGTEWPTVLRQLDTNRDHLAWFFSRCHDGQSLSHLVRHREFIPTRFHAECKHVMECDHSLSERVDHLACRRYKIEPPWWPDALNISVSTENPFVVPSLTLFVRDEESAAGFQVHDFESENQRTWSLSLKGLPQREMAYAMLSLANRGSRGKMYTGQERAGHDDEVEFSVHLTSH